MVSFCLHLPILTESFALLLHSPLLSPSSHHHSILLSPFTFWSFDNVIVTWGRTPSSVTVTSSGWPSTCRPIQSRRATPVAKNPSECSDVASQLSITQSSGARARSTRASVQSTVPVRGRPCDAATNGWQMYLQACQQQPLSCIWM